MPARREPSTPRRAAVYKRISLDRTGARLGVVRQGEECEAFAARLGWQLVGGVPYEDNDISAASGKQRPHWERLLRDIESGEVDALIAWHLDRCLRRLDDLSRLMKAIEASPHQFQVAFVQAGEIDLNTGPGRLLATILAGVAVNESDTKAERVRSARRQEAAAGKAHTHLGYGYNSDQTINPGQRAVVVEVKERLLSGDTLLGIARDLNAREVPTPASGKWTSRHVARAERLDTTPQAVRVLIRTLREERAIKAGEAARLVNAATGRRDNGEKWRASDWRADAQAWDLLSSDLPRSDSQIARLLIQGGVPTERMYWRAANLRAMIRRGSLCGWREFSPGRRGGYGELVAQGDWTPILTKKEIQAVRRITDRRQPVRGGRAPQHLLTGILRCGRCNAKMGGHTDKRTGVSRYGCSQQPGLPERCGKTAIVGAPVDAMVTETIIDLLSDSGFRTNQRTRRAKTSAEVGALEEELDELRSALQAYTDDAANFRISHEQFRTISTGLNARIAETEKSLGTHSKPLQQALRDIPQRREGIRDWWNQATLERKREVVSVLIDAVPVHPPTRRGNRFDPSRVGEPIWRI